MIQKKYSVATILLLLNFICAGSFNLNGAGAGAGSKSSQFRPGQHTPRHGNRQVVDLHAASKKTFELKRSKSELAERKPVSWSRYFACFTCSNRRKTSAQAAKKGEKYALKAGSSRLDATVSTTTTTKTKNLQCRLLI